MSDWKKIKLKDIENAFYKIFNPELLYGEQADIYDEALKNANHFGTTWKKEMQKIDEYVYLDFITNYLEEEEVCPEDFEK